MLTIVTTGVINDSGSGKTTLLNSLTGRNLDHVTTSGVIRVNGQQCNNTTDGQYI